MIARRPVDEQKLAQRRLERQTQLTTDLCLTLDAGIPVVYKIDGEHVKEYADGRRFVVRLIDAGRSEVQHVREVLSADERARIAAFVDEPDGAVAKARAFGIDVSQTMRNALLTPEERWRRANATIAQTRALFGAARRGRIKSN